MKRPSFFLTLVLTVIGLALPFPSARANPSKHTANYVRGHGEALVRKKVSLDVSWVQPMRWKNTEDVHFFAAHTWDERQKLAGGVITIAVDASASKNFVRKFQAAAEIEQRGWGGDFETRRLYGQLREGNNRRLFVDMTTVGVDPHQVPAGNPLGEAIAEFFRQLKENSNR